MRFFIVFLVVLLSGCSLCEKKQPIRYDQNNVIRQERKRIIEDKIFTLSEADKIELKKAYSSMRFALNISEKSYEDKVEILKNKYFTQKQILDPIITLDLQVSSELEARRMIEAKHLIYNALQTLEK